MAMKILQSKIEQPRRPGIMHRGRLTNLFDPISPKKLVAVTAGAGFGKTTLMIDVNTHLDIKLLWYRLDGQDSDFHVFLSYLYALFNRDYKTGERPNFRIKTQTEILMDWLAMVEKIVSKPTAIILDDYHLIQSSDSINQAIEFILQRLPNKLVLVIMGRKQLPLTLSGLRVKGQILEISEQELSFSNSEIHAFFRELQDLNSSDIDTIDKTGQGWAAGLVLMRYAIDRNSSGNVRTSIQQFQQAPEYIFSYLKEHIFDQQSEQTRMFMMKIALLPEIDTQLCSRIFKIDDAEQILTQMVNDHLFLFPGNDSRNLFFLHHLFQDFLLTQLHQTLADHEIRDLHCKIAHALEHDDVCQALNHYIKGHSFENAVRLIKDEEIQFMLGGRINFLGRQIHKLPKSLLDQNPELLISLSRLYSHHGNPQKAIELIKRALKLFKKTQANVEMASCVVELASQYYYSGHLKEARLMMEQVLKEIPKESQTYIIAMTFLTFLCSVLGDNTASETHDKNAREVINQYPDFEKQVSTALIDISLTHTRYFSGDFEQSQHLCYNLLKRVIDLDILPCLPLVYYQLSTNAFFLHDFQNGCDYACSGIEVCEKINLTDSRKAWVYLAWAQNSLGLQHLDEAIEKIHNAILLFEEPGNRWGLASAWDCLAAIYLKQKRPGKAKKILEKARSIIKGYGLTVTQAILNNRYAAALLDEKQFDKALEQLKVSAVSLKSSTYHRFNNLLMTARANAELENISNAFSCLEKTLELAATHNYDRFILEEKNWILLLIEQHLLSLSRFPSNISEYLNSLFDFAKPPLKMEINLLGPFLIRIHKRNLNAADFKSTKALMLLKYLAAQRSQGYINREILIELLWPDQDPQKTSARFNMAMSALRKILEPNLPPKAPSAYIDRKKDGYRLFSDDRIIIDTELFLSYLPRANELSAYHDQALELYYKAFNLYRGEFLEEDRFEQWCIEDRFFFSSKYQEAVKKVIQILEQKQDWDNALSYSELLLKENPLDEAVVEKVMLYFSKNGQSFRIKSTYDAYVATAKNSDIPISKKLSNLYQNLV